MPIVRQKFITRSDLRENPEQYYVFGDNVKREGFGGQAAYMRGEPNAIGVVTKWAPDYKPRSFFSDSIACRALVERDLDKVGRMLAIGKTVVVPADGIGTGLARLPEVAPKLHQYIELWFAERAVNHVIN